MTDKSSYSETRGRLMDPRTYIFPADHHLTPQNRLHARFTRPLRNQRPAVLMLGRLLRQKEPMIWQPEAALVIIYLRASWTRE